MANPQAPRSQPATWLAAVQASREALAALREAPAGHRLQVDLKFIAPIGGRRKKHYQFTAIDDCTRLRVLRIYDRLNQKIAIQFLDYVLDRLPFRVECIQTDNGSEFQAAFHWHLLDRGIQHVYIRPATPRLNGKVERSHRIDDEEFYRMLDGVVVDNTQLFNVKLQEWEHFYNFDRPHAGLGGQTPYERLREKTKAPSSAVYISQTLVDPDIHNSNTCEIHAAAIALISRSA
jgi:transposase InsO family protein